MRKLPYFDPEWSIAEDNGSFGSRLLTIASRYVGANPPTTLRIRAVSMDQPVQGTDGSWQINLASRL